MPWALRLTIFVSILFHAGTILLLGTLSLWRTREAVELSPAGGVVWLNLEPGGEGTGGAGGLGAPEKSSEEEAAAKPEEKKPAEIQKPKEQAKKKKKVTAFLPKEKLPQPEENQKPSDKAAVPGPGQGDTSGAQTGPGGGSGAGAGPGTGSGSGGGEGPGGMGPRGTGGEGSGGTGDKTLGIIRSKILRAKRYPPEARREGIEGVCGIWFAIQPDGSLLEVKLMESSGHDVLDREALATVRRAAPYPYYASPIRFKLRFSLKDR